MKTAKIIFWSLFVVTMGLYATMVFWTLPSIQTEAGGLIPFDLRPMGYSYEDALVFLSQLSESGRTLYLGPQHTLDLLYPLCLASCLALAIAMLVPNTKVWKFLISLVAWPGMLFDYLENGAVKKLLVTPVDEIGHGMVTAASTFTLLKSVFDTIAFVTLLFLVLLWLFRLRAARRTAL
ncbi:hypothetical protein [Rhizobium sp. L1K21]|uniref:hypothetical protein n=1 Tax=Rhizobium sp. L1K21 TaxID=2954933 RepID=UPI002093036E|nr:hypothetical protein [Rhizobium sp. L1K21]MCO6185128.1 hypothetical protein [Rhizobium sp. L1K21]